MIGERVDDRELAIFDVLMSLAIMGLGVLYDVALPAFALGGLWLVRALGRLPRSRAGWHELRELRR